jgi:hypothetical protein
MPRPTWTGTATPVSRPGTHARKIFVVEPSFGEQFLDIAGAQGEPEIKPDRVLDDLGRVAMAAI